LRHRTAVRALSLRGNERSRAPLQRCEEELLSAKDSASLGSARRTNPGKDTGHSEAKSTVRRRTWSESRESRRSGDDDR
jgi:hypothetical protein